MTSSEWTRILRLDDCPAPGKARFVACGTHELAVFHVIEPSRLIVAQNSCPHAGGNLAAGELCGMKVTCPWHHWEFDLTTGGCTLAEGVRLRIYESREADGWLLARLS